MKLFTLATLALVISTQLSIAGTANDSKNTYSTLSTIALQEKVEELSNHGTLPFDMGVELLRRWSSIK